MSGTHTVGKHRKRFKQWQNLAGPKTRFLASEIEARLVGLIEARGFGHVELNLGDPDWPVSGREYRLERRIGDLVDSVDFNFAKSRAPRVQIHFSRRLWEPPHAFVRSGSLVARPTRYYHFWGKPWWLPTRLWPDSGSSHQIAKVEGCFQQVFEFLEHGTVGKNISRQG